MAYKTYVTAFAMFITGLAAYIDPGMAVYVSNFLKGFGLDIPPSVLVMVCGMIMFLLRTITHPPEK